MRTVGIKLADGSFYPIMEEGSASLIPTVLIDKPQFFLIY